MLCPLAGPSPTSEIPSRRAGSRADNLAVGASVVKAARVCAVCPRAPKTTSRKNPASWEGHWRVIQTPSAMSIRGKTGRSVSVDASARVIHDRRIQRQCRPMSALVQERTKCCGAAIVR